MRHCIITALFTCWLVMVSAQHPWYHHITTYDGLPSNTVYWMLQDSRDYMWMGTEGGLIRYDGKNFKVFNDHPDLTSYDFNSVHEDSKGDIWSHNFANQIVRVRGDSMTVFEHHLFTPEGEYLELVVGDRDDIYVRIKEKIVRYFPEQDDYEDIYKGTHKNMFHMSYAEGVLSATLENSNILFRYNEQLDTSYITKPFKNTEHDTHFKSFRLTAELVLMADKTHIPQAIYTVRNDSLLIADDLKRYNLPKSFKLNNIKRLPNGDIWYCTTKGIYRQRDALQLLPGINTSNIVVDKENNLWISSLSEGIFVLPDLDIQLYTPDNSELYISPPTSIEPDEEHNLFIGTMQGKIFHWDVEHKKIIMEYRTDGSSYISRVHYDRLTQYLWTQGIYKFKKGNPNYEQGTDSGVKQIFTLPNDELLIRGGRDRLFQLSQHDITQFPQNPFSDVWMPSSLAGIYGLGDKFFNSPINTIWYDTKDDKIWLALGNRTMVNTRDTIYEFFIPENESLISNSFTQSPDDDIWIGVKGGGFVIIRNDEIKHDFRNEKFEQYGNIRLIQCTEKHAWLITENHLLVIDYEGKILRQYNAAMGIEANNITDMTVSDNRAWLCSKNGLFSIDFRQKQSPKPPVPIIQTIEIQGINHPVGNYQLPYHQNTLNPQFTSIFPYDKVGFEYLYRLKGEHEDWRATNTTSVSYPRLSPDNYTFELKTRKNSGEESEIVSFDIKIKKPYWQNIWFILGSILGIAAILFWWYRRNEQRKAERNYHDQQLRSSQLTSLKTQMNPHFMFNALNSIQEFIILNEKRLANEYLSKFARLMRVYLNHSNKDRVPLEEEIQALKLYLDLEQLRFENAQIQLNIDPQLELEHIHIPPLFVQPYVENAFKHGLLHKTNDRKLDISFSKITNHTLQIIIEDNGVGREKAMEIKSKRANKNLSFSTTANQKRLQLLNYNKQQKIEVKIIDLQENKCATGTKVIIQIPNYELTG